MRFITTSLLISTAALCACKAQHHGAHVRDLGDAATADLGAQLSELASAMTADLNVLYAGDLPPHDDTLALDDAAPVLSEAELDTLRNNAAAANAAFRRALAAADRRVMQRVETMTRLRTRLDATHAALAQISPADTARYRQGLADISRVIEEMNDAFAASVAVDCPAGYIRINGDRAYGTGNFCVMKYEAKKGANDKPESTAAGRSWTPGSWLNAKNACETLGAGYALISNPEWMTIGTAAAATAANWSGGAVGAGRLSFGNPRRYEAAGPDGAPCANGPTDCTPATWAVARRTYALGGNQVIWDFSGNGAEFVNYSNAARPHVLEAPVDRFPAGPGMEMTAARPTHATHPFWDDAWGVEQGMGSYWWWSDASPTAIFMVRGGAANDSGANGGPFSLTLGREATEEATFAFRCAFHP